MSPEFILSRPLKYKTIEVNPSATDDNLQFFVSFWMILFCDRCYRSYLLGAIRCENHFDTPSYLEKWTAFGQLQLMKRIFSTEKTRGENSLIFIRVAFSIWNHRICSWQRQRGVGEICKFRHDLQESAHFAVWNDKLVQTPDIKVFNDSRIARSNHSMHGTSCALQRHSAPFPFDSCVLDAFNFNTITLFFTSFVFGERPPSLFCGSHVLVDAFQEPL